MKFFKNLGNVLLFFCSILLISCGVYAVTTDSYNAGKMSIQPEMEQSNNEFTLKIQQLQYDLSLKESENVLLTQEVEALTVERDNAIASGEFSQEEIDNLNVQINELNETINENNTQINTLSSRVERLIGIIDKSVTEVYAEDLEGMNQIGKYSFSSCKNLISIELPNSITKIGSYAFENCTKLESVIMSTNLESIDTHAFASCDRLTNIYNLENSKLSSLGSNAFSGCDLLVNISFPTTLKKIDSYAFFECTSLANIILPESLTTLGAYAFKKTGLTSISVTNNITSLSGYVFQNCTNLSSVYIDVVSCPDALFSECRNLKTITFSNNVKTIGLDTFYNCAVETINLPDGLESLGARAFGSCDNLTSVVIPASVTNIGSSVFSFCRNLTEIRILSPTPPVLDSINAIPDSATLYVYGVDTYLATDKWSGLSADRFVEITD